ncbi:MAG: hypothetical protein WD425_05765 [Nitrospirales bacterium]
MLSPPLDNHHDDSSDTGKAAPTYANELPGTVMGKASEALVTLATTGIPDPLQAELSSSVMSSEELQKKVGNLLNLWSSQSWKTAVPPGTSNSGIGLSDKSFFPIEE